MGIRRPGKQFMSSEMGVSQFREENSQIAEGIQWIREVKRELKTVGNKEVRREP